MILNSDNTTFHKLYINKPGGSTTATPALATGLSCCQDMFFFFHFIEEK